MANGSKDFPINAVIITLLLLSFFGMFWLNARDIKAGTFYITLILSSLGLFVFVTLYRFVLKKDDRFYYKVPVDSSYNRAVLMGYIGLVGGVLFLVLWHFYAGATGGFVMAPLANFGGDSVGQPLSFAALDAQNSPGWKHFVIGVTAPVSEEFAFGFVAVLVGAFIAYTILLGVENLREKKFSERASTMFTFVIGVLISVFFFAGLHVLNGTYLNADGTANWALLGWAALFRLVLNVLIYLTPTFGLMFGVGVHMLINHVSLGGRAIWDSLSGGGIGWLIIVIYVWLLFSLFGVINAVSKHGFKSVFKWRSPEQIG